MTEGIYISILNWAAAFVFITFASVMMLGTKTASTRAYAVVAYCAAGWALGLGMYFYATSPRWLVFWNEWNHLLAGLIAVSFYYFTILIPREEHPKKYTVLWLTTLELLFLYAYFFTDLIIIDSGFLARASLDRYADLFFSVGPIFYIHFFVFLTSGFFILYRKIQHTEDATVKRHLSYILGGTAIGVIPPVLTDIILPYLGFYELYWMAGIVTLGWVAFISYSIARHHLFNARLVVTAIASTAIIVIAGLLFADIFLTANIVFGIAGKTVIFLAFAAVGSFLIAGIVHAEHQREVLKRLSGDLTALNTELNQRVESRTEALRREKEEGEQIIENLAEALIEYDANFRVLQLNRAALLMFDIRREVVIGKQITPSDNKNASLAALVAITFPVISASMHEDTARHGRSDGAALAINEVVVDYPYRRELEVTTIRLSGADAEDHFIKVVRDISKEKQVSRSKSEFITVAGHRLRTPLSVIKWTFSLMLEGDSGRINKKEFEAISRANQTNERMIRLVNDLLDTAHIEEGQFGYDIREGDLMTLIREIVPEFETLSKEKRVSLVTPTEHVPHLLYFDREKMSLALRNLLENAIHYTPSGGSVSLSVTEEPDNIAIAIRDTGIGIREDEQAKLFTKFFRGTNAKRERNEGTGLGLFIVKNIVARHGGSITVQSTVQSGSEFTVRMPRDPKRIPEYAKR
ncbi:MAG: hypothetical protein HYS59_00940 [Candidatus Vogelbacteria bacterium]|nr:hypothetical protein [Candidatus Vogelbacteria bacterium]